MPPTPINANAQLDILYVCGTLPHKLQLRVQYATGGFGASELEGFGGNPNVPTATYAATVADGIKTLWGNTAAINGWILQAYDSLTNSYTTIDVGALSVVGTNATAFVPAQQMTMTAYDVAGKLVRLEFMETSFPINYRAGYAAADAVLKAVIDKFMDTTAGEIGDCYRSRAGNNIAAPLNFTGDQNDALKRARGLG